MEKHSFSQVQIDYPNRVSELAWIESKFARADKKVLIGKARNPGVVKSVWQKRELGGEELAELSRQHKNWRSVTDI